jgi:LL-H family phage holin
MESLQNEIINLLALLIAGCVGVVSKHVVAYLKKKGVVAQINNHKELTNLVVGAVEQTYKHLHGEEKLNLAKIELIKLAKEKGVKVSEKELDILIESAVKEMNKSIKEELKK